MTARRPVEIPVGCCHASSPSARGRERSTILVVDDEPEVLRSIHDLLRLDYRVLTAESAEQALPILESDVPIDVVLSDQRMPGMSGVELLSRARELRPEATRLLITAYADIKAVIDAINQGSIYRYLHKPWDPDEFQSVIRQAVEQHDLLVERDRLIRELSESNRRLVEADRLKSAFLEVASHELNTPVAVVLGLAQLWKITQADRATETERHWMERIHHAGKRLASTVDRMLDLIRAEDFGRPLDMKSTPVLPLLYEAVESIRPFAASRHQEILVEASLDSGEACLDGPKVVDALTNLLINAVKFTPDGGTLHVAVKGEGDDAVRFAVTDSGVGIAADARPYVFQPFFTGFDTRHHSSGEYEFCKRGIGLGLCLVKRFVELHGGTVGVASEPGVGSTFWFTLPRGAGRKPAATNGHAHSHHVNGHHVS